LKASVKKKVEKMFRKVQVTPEVEELMEKYSKTHTLSRRDLKVLTRLADEFEEETEAA
jgi:hypothetical protein